jgi:hypothetical protein
MVGIGVMDDQLKCPVPALRVGLGRPRGVSIRRSHLISFDQSAHCGNGGALEIRVSRGDHGEKWHAILHGRFMREKWVPKEGNCFDAAPLPPVVLVVPTPKIHFYSNNRPREKLAHLDLTL